MLVEVSAWLANRTYAARDLPAAEILHELKAGRTAALVIPALNEEPTLGRLFDALHADAAVRRLLDDIVVVDGGSTDRTAAVAAAGGARVVAAADVAPDHAQGGKGGSVWRAVQVTTAGLLVIVDADLDPFQPRWIAALMAPLLLESDVALVKAAADRPLLVDGILHPGSGGRVTELVARPLLNALWPQLAGFVQPLSGELAATRSLLEQLPITTGYGLEIGMLVDALGIVGLDRLAQVDIGERRHRHQSDMALGRMASAVIRTALTRVGPASPPDDLVQFVRDDLGRLAAVTTHLDLTDLPPVTSLRGDRSVRDAGTDLP